MVNFNISIVYFSSGHWFAFDLFYSRLTSSAFNFFSFSDEPSIFHSCFLLYIIIKMLPLPYSFHLIPDSTLTCHSLQIRSLFCKMPHSGELHGIFCYHSISLRKCINFSMLLVQGFSHQIQQCWCLDITDGARNSTEHEMFLVFCLYSKKFTLEWWMDLCSTTTRMVRKTIFCS